MKNILTHKWMRIPLALIALLSIVALDTSTLHLIDSFHAKSANDLTFHTENKTVTYEVTDVAPFHDTNGTLKYYRFTFSDGNSDSQEFYVCLPDQPSDLTLRSQWAVKDSIYSTDSKNLSDPKDVVKHNFKYLHETLTSADMSQYRDAAKKAYLGFPSFDLLFTKFLILIFSLIALCKLPSFLKKIAPDEEAHPQCNTNSPVNETPGRDKP